MIEKQYNFFKKDKIKYGKFVKWESKNLLFCMAIFSTMITMFLMEYHLQEKHNNLQSLIWEAKMNEKKKMFYDNKDLKNYFIKHDIKSINIEKEINSYANAKEYAKFASYKIKTTFNDMTEINERYNKNTHLADNQNYVLNINLENELYIKNLEQVASKYNIDKKKLDRKITKEIKEGIDRSAYEYILKQSSVYSRASFSEVEKEKFVTNFPKWSKEILKDFTYNFFTTSKVFSVEASSTVNMLADLGHQIEKSDLCKIASAAPYLWRSPKDFENIEEKEFLEILSKESLQKSLSKCS